VLCRDAADPDHFYLIGEWADIEEHRRIREFVAREIKPEFFQLIEAEIDHLLREKEVEKWAAVGSA
jgi:quinol monooxygenase YgiN